MKTSLITFIFYCLLVATVANAQLVMPTNEGIEARVTAYFPDAPQMVAIAKCESGFRQYGPSGAPLAGGAAGNYIGVFQISSGHAAEAMSLGMDIYRTDENLAYAKFLYQKQGTALWSGCVKNVTAPVVAIPPPAATTITNTPDHSAVKISGKLTLNLKIGMKSPEVIYLQQILNAKGFTVGAIGPGSPGNETNTFGALTKQAVQKFQCAKSIACSGSESTTGYGRVEI